MERDRKERNFADGWVEYTAREIPENNIDLKEVSPANWDDGYLAYSQGEIRIDKRMNDIDFVNRTHGTNGVKGYLMEINFWKKTVDTYEEISIEREDSGFFYQKWTLHTKPGDYAKPNYRCHYRKAPTMVREPIGKGAKQFEDDDLSSIEVVCPERRLHFFITEGDKQ